MKRFYALYAALILLIIPTLAFASDGSEGIHFGTWFAIVIILLALALPLVLFRVMRSTAQK